MSRFLWFVLFCLVFNSPTIFSEEKCPYLLKQVFGESNSNISVRAKQLAAEFIGWLSHSTSFPEVRNGTPYGTIFDLVTKNQMTVQDASDLLIIFTGRGVASRDVSFVNYVDLVQKFDQLVARDVRGQREFNQFVVKSFRSYMEYASRQVDSLSSYITETGETERRSISSMTFLNENERSELLVALNSSLRDRSIRAEYVALSLQYAGLPTYSPYKSDLSVADLRRLIAETKLSVAQAQDEQSTVRGSMNEYQQAAIDRVLEDAWNVSNELNALPGIALTKEFFLALFQRVKQGGFKSTLKPVDVGWDRPAFEDLEMGDARFAQVLIEAGEEVGIKFVYNKETKELIFVNSR